VPRNPEKSMCNRAHLVTGRSKTRSSITNGSKLGHNVDGRSADARRFRDLVRSYEQEVGGEVSAIEADLIRQAALATLRCEQLQGAVIRGEPIDDGELTRLLGASRRLLAILYSKADARKATGPTPLQQYLARKAAQADDIDEDDADEG
jgi:ribosomal protein L2